MTLLDTSNACVDIGSQASENFCYACLSGINDAGHSLDRCHIKGTQRCGFFQSCKEESSERINTNKMTRHVFTCQVDALRIICFVLGTICCLLFAAIVVWRSFFASDSLEIVKPSVQASPFQAAAPKP